MKISVDGGAVEKNEKYFGTKIFGQNLIRALGLYDRKNEYIIYDFEHFKPKIFWLKLRLSLEELIRPKDIFLALNQAIPVYTSGKVISFNHGLSYLAYPDMYSKKEFKRLSSQLRETIERSDKLILSSVSVKKELEKMSGSLIKKLEVMPFGVSLDMLDSKLTNIKKKYFLWVGSDRKIKNLDFILEAFRNFLKKQSKSEYRLYLVGTKRRFKDKNIRTFWYADRNLLKKLYSEATALLTASFYESFNLPVLEALSCGCPVIGLKTAIIAELSEYTNEVNNREEFEKKMQRITVKPDDAMIAKIRKRFSWKNYVENLLKLY